MRPRLRSTRRSGSPLAGICSNDRLDRRRLHVELFRHGLDRLTREEELGYVFNAYAAVFEHRLTKSEPRIDDDVCSFITGERDALRAAVVSPRDPSEPQFDDASYPGLTVPRTLPFAALVAAQVDEDVAPVVGKPVTHEVVGTEALLSAATPSVTA